MLRVHSLDRLLQLGLELELGGCRSWQEIQCFLTRTFDHDLLKIVSEVVSPRQAVDYSRSFLAEQLPRHRPPIVVIGCFSA